MHRIASKKKKSRESQRTGERRGEGEDARHDVAPDLGRVCTAEEDVADAVDAGRYGKAFDELGSEIAAWSTQLVRKTRRDGTEALGDCGVGGREVLMGDFVGIARAIHGFDQGATLGCQEAALTDLLVLQGSWSLEWRWLASIGGWGRRWGRLRGTERFVVCEVYLYISSFLRGL